MPSIRAAAVLRVITLCIGGGPPCCAAAPWATDPIDVRAMHAIAKSTGADRSMGWGVRSSDLCDGTWPGVRCDRNLGRVTYVDTRYGGLAGAVSGTDLSDLAFLSLLDLSHNRLSGDLPALTRPLSYLTSLNLSSNAYLGSIPDYFGKNSKIKFLDISSRSSDGVGDGSLTGRLDFVAGMTDLVEIHVGGNSFYEPLPDVTALVNLKVFDAANNKLCGRVRFPPGVKSRSTSTGTPASART